MRDTRRRPFSVSQDEYPFSDHWFERDGVAMHYVDEGSGTPVDVLGVRQVEVVDRHGAAMV